MLKNLCNKVFFSDTVAIFSPLTPIDLYGMFQIKTWTVPFWLLRVEIVYITGIHTVRFCHYSVIFKIDIRYYCIHVFRY